MNTLSRKAQYGALISIGAYIFLSLTKIGFSFLTSSSALRADGLNNLTDIGASLAVYIGLRISKKPRDPDHPYGHSRAEQIASLVASFIMMSVGLQVIFQASKSFFTERTTAPDPIAAGISLCSALFMYMIYRYNHKLAHETKSKSLEAAAKDNFSDALVSIATSAGIVASQFGMPIIDPIFAVVVGVVICKTAWEIFSETSHMLTDGIDPNHMKEFKKTVQSVEGVVTVVDIRARMYGNDTFVDVTIQVDSRMKVWESHCIADAVEEKLFHTHGVGNSHVHIEPSDTSVH
ncbi:cation diffusion facilitator family transporter [Ectobacillus sp. JY-23]|uniref:cation diffusion facilitator family transporter n=1 Tax=Ectobacillus sp. JY-23 TaxID=2933872 RepID=UPI001FF2789E|nr:cation diffusion facilitator family transporter [Ectobacillus sp. JY-23]UOY94421.1 cation diffusion facilitator family transporter [Ectobacillus sp. JY-23]